ncbi:MAG: hypothetical protein OT477_22310 [Chloroflexi bacterium]|nr:hypothetical protein [Chloroflexota bacterium]
MQIVIVFATGGGGGLDKAGNIGDRGSGGAGGGRGAGRVVTAVSSCFFTMRRLDISSISP